MTDVAVSPFEFNLKAPIDFVTTVGNAFVATGRSISGAFPPGALAYVAAKHAREQGGLQDGRANREVARVGDLGTLADGWAGPDSYAPLAVTLRNASQVLRAVARYVPEPDIIANENGTVTLEWQTRAGYASIEVGSTRFAFMLDADGHEPAFANGFVGDMDIQVAHHIYQRLFDQTRSIPPAQTMR